MLSEGPQDIERYSRWGLCRSKVSSEKTSRPQPVRISGRLAYPRLVVQIVVTCVKREMTICRLVWPWKALCWCWGKGINSPSRGLGILKLPTPLLVTPCLWDKAVPSVGFNLPCSKPFCAGKYPCLDYGHGSSHHQRVKVLVHVLMSICSVYCQTGAIHRPVHTMCPSSLHNKGEDRLICQDCVLLISMCGRSNLYGKERFVSQVHVWSLFCKQWLLPPHWSENILKFHCLDILKNENNMKHKNH